jgi:hypothetical protein
MLPLVQVPEVKAQLVPLPDRVEPDSQIRMRAVL